MQKIAGHISIKKWSDDDRPREKLLNKGKASLSDAELLAILIGSGTREMTAVDVAKNILSQLGNDINSLANLNVSELKKFKGIGEAKAITIISALEIGRRRKAIKDDRFQVRSSKDVVDYISKDLFDLKHEEFWVLYLNVKNTILKMSKISSGGISGTFVDPRIIFKEGLELYASGIILIHNHPSGNSKPSKQDIALTESMKKSGKLLEIPVLDHVIFSNNNYFSFSDEGMM